MAQLPMMLHLYLASSLSFSYIHYTHHNLLLIPRSFALLILVFWRYVFRQLLILIFPLPYHQQDLVFVPLSQEYFGDLIVIIFYPIGILEVAVQHLNPSLACQICLLQPSADLLD